MTPLENLAAQKPELPGSPWFLEMTDTTRDKSIMRLVLMVSQQSMMEGCDGHGQEAGGGGLIRSTQLWDPHFTPALEVQRLQKGSLQP